MNLAAARGDTTLLRNLIEKSEVGIYASDCSGRTPLHEAASAGHLGCVTDILSTFGGRGGHLHPDEKWPNRRPGRPVSRGWTWTWGDGEATASNSTIGEYLDWTTEDGRTALFLAVLNHHVDIVQLLLNEGGTIHIKDQTGLSPLHMAVIVDNLEMVKLLIEKGADVNASDAKFRSCLHYAAEKGFCGIVEILAPLCLDRCDTKNKTPLYLAAENGHDHCLEILAEAGAWVNTRAADFTTPLMAATTNEYDKCVEVLLNYKASPNLHCSHVWPKLPIHAAVKGRNRNILKMLIAVTDRAVDRSEGMVSPVYEAVDNPPMLELLLSEGFSPDGQNCRDMYVLWDSPLSLVMSQGDTFDLESIRRPLHILMAAGASVTRNSWDECLAEPSLLSLMIQYREDTRRKQQHKTKELFGSSELRALQSELRASSDYAADWLPNLLTAGLDPSVFMLRKLFRTVDNKMLNYLLAFMNWTTLSPELTDVLQQRQKSKTWIPDGPVEGFPSLLHMCRLKIRDTVGSHVLLRTNIVQQLPVPAPLHNFVTFSDILP